MADSSEQVTFAEVMQKFIESSLIDLHVAMPGKIQSYDAESQTADIIPMLNRSLWDGKDNYITEQLPVLPDVPICFPRAGGFFISFPIQVGDFVTVIFAERNIGYFRSHGNQGDPGDLGMHTLDGAMAFPSGPYPFSDALAGADSSNMELGSDVGTGKIEITPVGVSIGGGYATTADYQLLGTTFRTAQAALDLIIRVMLPNIATALTNVSTDASFQPAFTAAATQFGNAASAFTAMYTAYETFEAAAGSYLSTINKVK